jgi:hypothetical protein
MQAKRVGMMTRSIRDERRSVEWPWRRTLLAEEDKQERLSRYIGDPDVIDHCGLI